MLPRSPKSQEAVRALRNPHFRWLTSGTMGAGVIMGMRTVAPGWLVYNVAGSVLALGWVSAGRARAPVLLGPLAAFSRTASTLRRASTGQRAGSGDPLWTFQVTG